MAINNADSIFLSFIRAQPGVVTAISTRVYGSPEPPPEQLTASSQFALVYPKGLGGLDESLAIGTRLYSVESYALTVGECQRLDDIIFEAIEGRANGRIRNIDLDLPRQIIRRPDNKWMFALTSYKVMFVTGLNI